MVKEIKCKNLDIVDVWKLKKKIETNGKLYLYFSIKFVINYQIHNSCV